MLIIHIITGLDVGGAESMLKRLIESHLGNKTFRHMVISLTTIGKVGQQLQALGIEVQALNMHSPLAFPRALWQLVRRIRALRPDIVQTWMYHADFLGGIAARLAGNRHVIWGVHSTELKTGEAWTTQLVQKLCAWISEFVPHTIVCVAEAAKKAHIRAGYDARRMIVIPNGFDVSRLVATAEQRAVMRTECGFGEKDVVIGSLGRFHAVKDHHNFVRAATLLANRYPHVRFLLVGRDLVPANRELARWITETGHPHRFVLLGERADVPVCLAAMDMLCLHSRTEAFPLSVGEAMAMGLPCVVTDVGDAAVLVKDTGVVVPRENAAALAQGLENLLTMTPAMRQKLGQKAKARIYEEFTMDRARQRFEAIYGHLAGNGKH
ncbi:glycosyltransferase family 4 protein [Noviherbaspirillum massiliense]|uniref:glycosyltransferase family 4 protein n=1 Tax=Noviherbaspirillum massiliense TaxID=1465823 RepID=UPI00037BA029|nr:glycosyltransferase [Noviherbaspirillum massiliense]